MEGGNDGGLLLCDNLPGVGVDSGAMERVEEVEKGASSEVDIPVDVAGGCVGVGVVSGSGEDVVVCGGGWDVVGGSGVVVGTSGVDVVGSTGGVEEVVTGAKSWLEVCSLN